MRRRIEWSPPAVVAVIIVATLAVGTTAAVLVAIWRGEPLSTQTIGIISVVWGALAGGVSAWLGAQRPPSESTLDAPPVKEDTMSTTVPEPVPAQPDEGDPRSPSEPVVPNPDAPDEGDQDVPTRR